MNSYEALMRKLTRDSEIFRNLTKASEMARRISERMTQPMMMNIARQLDGASFGLAKIAANLPTNTAQLAIGKTLRESFAFKMPPLLQMPTPAALLGLQDSVNAIAKSIDFGRLVDLSSIAEKVRAALLRALPPNWPEDIDLFEVVDLLNETGLPVVWVPRGKIVASLVQAPDAEARDRILLNREEDVLGDIREVLAEIADDELSDAVTAVMQGLECFVGGHHGPAQTWCATILTSVLQETLRCATLREARETMTLNWEEQGLQRLRFALVAKSIEASLSEFWPHRGDPVPSRFNRHASAHRLSPEQFTRLNALISLMTVTSLLRELEQLIRDGEARRTDAA